MRNGYHLCTFHQQGAMQNPQTFCCCALPTASAARSNTSIRETFKRSRRIDSVFPLVGFHQASTGLGSRSNCSISFHRKKRDGRRLVDDPTSDEKALRKKRNATGDRPFL